MAEGSKMNITQCIKKFYVKYEGLGFDLKCVEHNHLNNNDDYMKLHLLREHNIKIPFDNWSNLFILFSVGDSYSSSYRCQIEGYEFLFENDAKEHYKKHGLRVKN